jgi:hypothetical protein
MAFCGILWHFMAFYGILWHLEQFSRLCQLWPFTPFTVVNVNIYGCNFMAVKAVNYAKLINFHNYKKINRIASDKNLIEDFVGRPGNTY